MATPTPVQPQQVGILILDEADNNQGALRQILDSEGWRVRLVQDPKELLAELKSGEWSLVIANIAMAGTDTPIFITLRELASVSHEEGGRIRVLYLVPELAGSQYLGALELAKAPYVVRPFHLHDFLEKVSDLLVEVKAIEGPIRQVRHEFGAKRKSRPGDPIPCLLRAILTRIATRKSPSTKSRKAKLPHPDATNPVPTSAAPTADPRHTPQTIFFSARQDRRRAARPI
jgi:CheY-like chemotaxis protein